MILNPKKIIVRLSVGIVMLSILAYIFWPQSNNSEKISGTTSTYTSQPAVQDAPCLVLYEKNKDTTIMKSTACVNTYVEKYKNSYYSKLSIVCRSSGDGKSINRNLLSQKRMEALLFDLMKLGINFKDMEAKAIGDTEPYPGIDPLSEDGKILNRSCEITGVK